jgi:hypothetical protein
MGMNFFLTMWEVYSLRIFENMMPVVIWSKVDEETGQEEIL